MKPYVLFSAAALATVLLASQASAQSRPADSRMPTDPQAGSMTPHINKQQARVPDAGQTVEQETVRIPMPNPPSDAAYDVASATAEPALVTNGPVLDTAENRAKYPPLSRAGKQTAARGN